jgi:6-phosphogluconate dehydrogenase
MYLKALEVELGAKETRLNRLILIRTIRMWRGGCIILSDLLGKIKEVYKAEPALALGLALGLEPKLDD